VLQVGDDSKVKLWYSRLTPCVRGRQPLTITGGGLDDSSNCYMEAPSCRSRLDAEARLWQAQEIFQRIGAAETVDVAAELDALTKTRPAPER
jgi:hypothetical protein